MVAIRRTPGPIGLDEVHVDPDRAPRDPRHVPSPVLDAREPNLDGVARPRTGYPLPHPRPLRQRPSPWPVLRRGSRGPAVGRLQRILNYRMATIAPARPKLAVDQIFGPLTEQSVVLFQGHAKIQRDGVVGRTTWAHLLSDTLLQVPASARGGRSRRGSAAQQAGPSADSGFASAPAASPAAQKPPPQSVADWPIEKKFEEALRRTLPKLPFAMQQEFAQLLTPEAIAVTAGILAVLAIAHLFGVGEAVDIALLLVGIVFLGLAIFDVVSHLIDFLVGTARAETTADSRRGGRAPRVCDLGDGRRGVPGAVAQGAFAARRRQAQAARARQAQARARTHAEAATGAGAEAASGTGTGTGAQAQAEADAAGLHATDGRDWRQADGAPDPRSPECQARGAALAGTRERIREAVGRQRIQSRAEPDGSRSKEPDYRIEGEIFDNKAPKRTAHATRPT